MFLRQTINQYVSNESSVTISLVCLYFLPPLPPLLTQFKNILKWNNIPKHNTIWQDYNNSYLTFLIEFQKEKSNTYIILLYMKCLIRISFKTIYFQCSHSLFSCDHGCWNNLRCNNSSATKVAKTSDAFWTQWGFGCWGQWKSSTDRTE